MRGPSIHDTGAHMIVIPSFNGSVNGNVMRYMPVMNQPRSSTRGTPLLTCTLSADRERAAGPVVTWGCGLGRNAGGGVGGVGTEAAEVAPLASDR